MLAFSNPHEEPGVGPRVFGATTYILLH